MQSELEGEPSTEEPSTATDTKSEAEDDIAGKRYK